jgi:uncharacterized protein (DUF1778 family)
MVRRQQVNVRLVPEERELLERAASAVGQSVSDFVRAAAVAAAGATLRRRRRDHEPAAE